MAMASYVVTNFLGGEVSQFAQGRFDRPDYKASLNVCLNGFPVEIGTWTRRPGTQYGGHTRAGAKGRVFEFDFEQANPVTMEFTDGWLRFRNGPSLLTTNDPQVISAISSANPAVVQTAGTNGWSTGNTVIFPAPCTPLLENRQFTITTVDGTHFSLQDALTGANIDGSTLGALASGATVQRVQELQTSYAAGIWTTNRTVQAETTDIVLNSEVAPQAVLVSTLPSAGVNAQFSISPVSFIDGPYLDPPTNGAIVVPNQTTGVIQLTVSFPLYVSTTSYSIGEFVTSSSVNYESLIDQNVGNTPVSSPSDWAPVSATAAINNGQGFLPTDVGRLIRLFSEPALWAVGTTYASGAVVSYNPGNVQGGTTYWSSLVGSNTGNAPGTDATNWQLVAIGGNLNPALWTWGKIVSLLNFIPGSPSGIAHIGTMTTGGGLAAAFDGNIDKNLISSANASFFQGGGGTLTETVYVGQNYSGASPASYPIQSATAFPSTNFPLAQAFITNLPASVLASWSCTMSLYASNSPPGNATAGTLLGMLVLGSGSGVIANGTVLNFGSQALTIGSNDTSTSYAYVWMTLSMTVDVNSSSTQYNFIFGVAQLEIVSASGSGSSSNGVNVELLGAPLLYNAGIRTWRLGVFSGTTGWPTCGCYAEGRIWLGGAVANRFDASVSNGLDGDTLNFAPTDQYGVVAENAAIDETLNSDSVNPILWMKPDLQGVVIGTQNGEWLVQAPTTGPIAANNIVARRMTKHGSAPNMEPVRTPHANIFVKRYGRKLLEYFADAFSGKYSAPNLSDKAEHIAANGIAEIGFTEATTPILWGRDTLGNLFGMTYKRDALMTSQPPDFYGWHRHALGSGRIVESICTGASVGGNLDALTMVTNDAITGIRHVEVLTDIPNETTALASSWFLDDAVNPTSTSISTAAVTGAPYGGLTINGLWHLNGKTVQVFAGGLDCGDRGLGPTSFTDFVVTNGSIFVPYGDGISAGSGRGLFTVAFAAALPLSQIVIGFTYNSDGQVVHPIEQAQTGARNGPAFGKKSRVHRYAAKVINSLGISFGSKFSKLFPARFADDTEITALPPLTTKSGILQNTLQDDYGYEHGICWRISRPMPANIAAIGANLETQDQ